MNLSTEQSYSLKEIEALLQAHEKLIERLEKETAEFYTELGVEPEELSEFLNQKSRFTNEAWEFMERGRKKLVEFFSHTSLPSKQAQDGTPPHFWNVEMKQSNVKKRAPLPKEHWIPVR